ncbi:MAG: radical SAM protein [Bdellovibrionota bacterium]
MRITFVRPHLFDARSRDALEPLVFAILKGLTPEEHSCELFDERIEALPELFRSDLVAISVETYTARRAYQIAARVRAQGVRVVMGGYHPTFFPTEALRFADAVVVGDAESVWLEILADAKRGRLKQIYRGDNRRTLSDVSFDRSIFQGKKYKRLVPIQFGRGCRFACDFCSIHAFYGSAVRTRPVADVINEIVATGARYVLFIDDNLFVDKERTSELFREVAKLKIRWACQITIDVAADEHLMDLMAASGCLMALIGFESLSDDNLRNMKKRWNVRGGDYASAIRKFKTRGIGVYASFVFGYDDDRPESFDRCAEFALESGAALAHFNTLTPMPGSGFYSRLVKDNRLLFPRWWLHPEYTYGQATFIPKHMSPQDLTEGCRRARFTFYRYRSITHRALAFLFQTGRLSDALLLAGTNIISRKEIEAKLGHRLGSKEPLEHDLLEDSPLTLESAVPLESALPLESSVHSI